MDDTNFRIRITERNVLSGRQGLADLDSVSLHGFITKPDSYREARSLCRGAAVEAAKDIDSKYKERRNGR
jgi:hypothetical protein